ncbi:sensor histidine kinase [Flavisolibacter nicotianae]|uniref:sensor histidine kinase n=1 Tax=Flavisolibacter nicotianae TaxID=2364882 RepID=UPI001F099870|nr:ATP-binding protein [Flavisolibacter nicotianae]
MDTQNVDLLVQQRATLEKELAAKCRELEIEAALDRVRTRAMAMQTSEELAVLIDTVQKELTRIEFSLNNCIFWIMREEPHGATWWVAPFHKTSLPQSYWVPFRNLPLFQAAFLAWKERKPIWVYTLEGEDKKMTNKDIFMQTDLAGFPLNVKRTFNESEKVFLSFSFYGYGGLHLSTVEPLAEDQVETLNRFSKVFDQAYTRFLDLKKAEAQAREGRIEAALEKVRSRSLAVHKSEEFTAVIKVVFEQLRELEIAVSSASINIFIEGSKDTEVYICGSGEDGLVLSHFRLIFFDHPIFNDRVDAYQKGLDFFSKTYSREEKNRFYEFEFAVSGLKSIPADIKKKVLESERYTISLAITKNSMIVVNDFEGRSLSAMEKDIIKRFARVFEQAYIRFLDLQKAEALALRAEQDLIEIKAARKKAEEALTKLSAAQAQLIHAEKMASLGELTAGIAHEIQNPLNFVINFSTVNRELLVEMDEEIEKGNLGEVKVLANDLAANEEKIAHHGQRADNIVKGMLQHAKGSTGVKQPTDINQLAEECMRLSYQGMRAKDKDFIATTESKFDQAIGPFAVVPQDIGRVLLNLFANAFYAVNEKRKKLDGRFESIIRVITKKEGNNILISVEDNGTGMSPQTMRKVFQPFFTTKPTGEGTGLGLSLSYDIITKGHCGTLSVQSTEGKGSEFVISLPGSQGGD